MIGVQQPRNGELPAECDQSFRACLPWVWKRVIRRDDQRQNTSHVIQNITGKWTFDSPARVLSLRPVHRLLRDLNPPQSEAVTTTRGPLLVLAGAGTGKTKVITHRMAWLIHEGVTPRNILALTFTNKAAREMKERFIQLAGGNCTATEARKLFAGTFHSFCVRVLRRFIDRLDYKSNFTIYDESDQMSVLRSVARGVADGDADLRRMKFLIGLAKNRGLDTPGDGDAALAGVFHRYQEEMKLRNAVDFDDLLVLVVRLLREDHEARRILREENRFLLVDEYQDTNALQFQIVEHLASSEHDVCVVGDDDQSIYSWRGAEHSHILHFERHFPGARVIKLEQNYRCTPQILQAANHVIRNNSQRHHKELWSDRPSGEDIRLVTAQGDEEEARWIVGDILNARNNLLTPWEQCAVLYRANHLSRAYEMELRRLKIPYRVVGGQEFYERREVKDVLAYLQVLTNPHHDPALLRIINNPPRGIGKTAIESLVRSSREEGCSVWSRAIQFDPAAPVGKFVLLLKHHQDEFRKPDASWSGQLRGLLQDGGVYDELKRTSKDGTEYNNRMENVQEFLSALANHQAEPGAVVSDFIDALVLDGRDKPDTEKKGFGVNLMTLHAAKGLEFDRVYLVGLEEGVLPNDRAKLEGNLEEERRLFYVGITRARRCLTLSLCDTRKRHGQEEPRHHSRFLNELPPDLLVPVDATLAVHEKLTPETAAGALSALKASLTRD